MRYVMVVVGAALAGLVTGDDAHAKSHPVFLEAGGLVVIEAESTASKPGQWKGMRGVEGFTGKGHIEFTGNKPSNGPPTSPIVYRFKIEKEGAYRLYLRAHKRLDGARHDLCNDAYVRVEGDYTASPDAGDRHNDDARLEDLRKDTKCYGGSHEGWGWAQTLDLGGHTNKRVPQYVFKPGKTYTLVVSGRSQRFNIDRIVFRHASVDEKLAKDPAQPESARR